MTSKIPSLILWLTVLAAGLLSSPGCEKEDHPLTLDDLTGGEYVYVERMVILERAKTIALIDRAAGDAVLDSLAAAWGDSSLDRTLAGAPQLPLRSEAVAALLRRVMAAEQDSLRVSSAFDRLPAPLPVPPAPEPEAEKTEGPESEH